MATAAATTVRDSDSQRSPANDNDMEKSSLDKGPANIVGLPDDPDEHLSAEERAEIDRKLVRKLDLTLIPWLSLLYLISFLDRTNIGNAKVAGMFQDLHLTNGTYNAALSIFFVSYSLFEPATNILLKKLRPHIFLTITMVLWGICMTMMGLVKDWRGLAAARFFLGITEAGLFPGINYLLSSWYRRREFGLRAAIFFSAAAIAGSFGGLLAAGIAQMDGIAGLPGWSWIFILEGLVTVFVGVACIWLVHDFPAEATFLTDDDRRRVLRRLMLDGQASAERESFKMAYFWASVKDWKTYCFAVIYMGVDGALYAFSLFLPTIIRELGYTATQANLLSVPPYVGGAILTILVGFYADRSQKRGWCNIVFSTLGILGFSLLVGTTLPGLKYAATFLGALGIYPLIANTVSWTANNTEGVYKRGVTLGFVIGWGNLNGVVSSNIYQTTDSPLYRTGHAVVLAYLTVFLFLGSILTHVLLERENKLRREGKRDYRVEGKPDHEIKLLGDMRPDFFYVT